MEIKLDSVLVGIEYFASVDPLQNIENTTIDIEGKMYDLSHLLAEIYQRQNFQLTDYKNLQQIKIALNRLTTREQMTGYNKEIQERIKDATLPLMHCQAQAPQCSSVSPDLKNGIEKSIETINQISLNIKQSLLWQVAAVEKDKFSVLERYFPLEIILQKIQPSLLTLEERSNIFSSNKTWKELKQLLLEVLKNKLQPKALEAVLSCLNSWHSILENLQAEERNLIRKKFEMLRKETEQNPDFTHVVNEMNQLSQNFEELGRDLKTFYPWQNALISYYNEHVNSKIDASLYLYKGICFGSSLEQAVKYINFIRQHNTGPTPTIQLSSMARFFQAMYMLEGSSNLFEKQQAALIEWNQVSNTINQKKEEIISQNITDVNSNAYRALEQLQKKKQTCIDTINQISDCYKSQYVDNPFSAQFAKHQKFVLKSLMSEKMMTNSNGIPIAEFVNSMMEQIFQEHRGEEVHLIVGLSHPLNEEVTFLEAPAQESQSTAAAQQEFQPWEESALEKKVTEILEGTQGKSVNSIPAPLAIREKIKASLLRGHLEKQQMELPQASNYISSDRHAIYMMLSKDHFELADSGLPGVQIFTSSDINSFRLLLLQWLSFYLYQKVSNIRQVTKLLSPHKESRV